MDSEKKVLSITEDNDIKITSSPVTGKRIVKLLSLFSIICFFLPFCLVSCSGEVAKVNGLKSTTGFTIYDQKVDGNLWCSLFLIVPIVILIFLLIKNLSQHKLSMLIVSIASIIMLFLLARYKTRVQDLAYDNGASVEFSYGYYINLVSQIGIFITSVLMLLYLNMQKLGLNLPIKLHNNSNIAVARVCSNCGDALSEEAMFCISCGTKYEEQASAPSCSNCGAALHEGARFCVGCGKEIPQDTISMQSANSSTQIIARNADNTVVQNVVLFFKGIFNLGKDIIVTPTTKVNTFIYSKDKSYVFGLFGLQAVFSSLFAIVLVAMLDSRYNVTYLLGLALHINLFKLFMLSIILSVVMSFVYAGIFMVVNRIFKNQIEFMTSLNVAAIRSITLIPITIFAILVALISPMYAVIVFCMGNFAAISYIMAGYPVTSKENNNRIPLITFISTVISSVISIMIMLKILG